MKEDVLRSLKAKEESEWTENETEQLIEYYKQNDILWNHSLSSYKDRNLKELSYTKLSELLPGRSHDDRMAQFVLKIEKLSHIMGPRASQDLRSPSPIMAPGSILYTNSK